MVLQPAGPRSSVPDRPDSHPRGRHPDPSRIAGISGTLVFNVLLLMLLLVPMSRPDMLPQPEATPEFRWVLPEQKKPEPPPAVVKVVKPRPKPAPRAKVEPDLVIPPIDDVVVDDGTLPADPLPDATIVAHATPAIEPGGPVSGVRLEYGDAPAPTYPRKQLLAGIEGTVLLQVLVDVDGRPLEVTIHHSSGDRHLDAAARHHVLRKWSFRPAMKDGRPVQAIGIVPIEFKLDRG